MSATVGFVLPLGSAACLSGLALVGAWSEAHPGRVPTVFAPDSLRGLSGEGWDWLDTTHSARETFAAALARPPLDEVYVLGDDPVGLVLGVVAGNRVVTLHGANRQLSAFDHWMTQLRLPLAVSAPTWAVRSPGESQGILLVPNRSQAGAWSGDDEWPSDEWEALHSDLASEEQEVHVFPTDPAEWPLPELAQQLARASLVVTADEGVAVLASLAGSTVVLLQPGNAGLGWFSAPNLTRIDPGGQRPLASLSASEVHAAIKKIQVPLAYF